MDELQWSGALFEGLGKKDERKEQTEEPKQIEQV